MIYNTRPINIPVIQEHINKKKKQLNELGFLYEKRGRLNPLRWGVKERYAGLNTMMSHLKEQVKEII
ncbi:hypothetical protein OAP55_01220 [Alphaproteobacteria bacterium]|nr:hypothetical protein [Alphaproteobacteria bacterium]